MSSVVLDLETVVDPDLPALPPKADGSERFPPPPYHKVVAVGALWLDERFQPTSMQALVGPNEEIHLRRVTERLSVVMPTVVTMNGRSFDLPVLVARCMKHAVPFRWYFRTKGVRYRYSPDGHLDLMDQLSDFGAAPRASLDVWAKLCGWPGKGETDGTKVASLVAEEKWSEIEKYVLSDVVQSAAVLLHWLYVAGYAAADEFGIAIARLRALANEDMRTRSLVDAAYQLPTKFATGSPEGELDYPAVWKALGP